MRHLLKWLGMGLLLVLLGIIALVVFAGYRLKDGQGNVAFGWDKTRHRFQIMEKPRLQLEGPHVFHEPGGYSVITTVPEGGDWRVMRRQLPAQPQPVLTVAVDNPGRTRFSVALRPTPAPVSAVVAENPARLLMLSDIEGQFDKFTDLLRAQGVIGDDLHWRYGDGHVALVGDFVDRGEDMTPVLWLIYRMEEEARVAGGRVHYVLGNHEQLAMSGKKGYWPRRLVALAQALGDDGDERLFSPQTVLGAWLHSKPVLAKVGDHLLVHGGVSQTFLALGLDVDVANQAARMHLNTPVEAMPMQVKALLGRDGLTWYRGMAMPGDKEHAIEDDPLAHLRQVTAYFGVKRVAIAHTIVPDVALEQQGMLLRLDVHHAEQVSQAALYEHGQLWRVDARGGRVLLR